MTNISKLLRICLTILLVSMSSPVLAQQFAVAGSPVSSIQDKNYTRLFTSLRKNGIRTYFPTFQYQEVPEPKSLGYESDFVAPCTPNDPGFKALRQAGMKLIIPGEFVYPSPERIGRSTPENDPLNQIIACAGRENLAGITNYDEAAFHGIRLADVKKFYAQVKKIDPTLPVLMVHGPIITDKRKFSSKHRIANYLEDVKEYSKHSDIVGFDVYPIPFFLAKVATPLSNGKEVQANEAIAQYTQWINQAVPNKRKLIVMQGFAYTDLYEKSFRQKNFPKNLLDLIAAPNKTEINMMVKQARAANVELVIWWGPSALETSKSAPWPAILEMGRKYGE